MALPFGFGVSSDVVPVMWTTNILSFDAEGGDSAEWPGAVEEGAGNQCGGVRARGGAKAGKRACKAAAARRPRRIARAGRQAAGRYCLAGAVVATLSSAGGMNVSSCAVTDS